MRRRGFTLLEMIVASTIMAIAVVGLLSGIAGAARNAARLRDYNRVVQLARMQMDELLLTPNPGAGGEFDPHQTGGVPAGWQARMSTVASPPAASPGQPSLQRIELQIWWMTGETRRTFALDAYRTHYQRAGETP